LTHALLIGIGSGTAEQAVGKRHICRPEPVTFAGEDLLAARKPKEKQIPHAVQKPNGVRNDTPPEFFCCAYVR
jgi:hypothetical protein